MNRKVLIMMMLCVIMMSICPVEVFGHSGRTDGSGGHYNRSTGEYHWHHGYGEHQHEDMDGDGDLDCPYSFDDQTGESGGGSSSGGSTYYRPPASPTPYRTPLPRNTPTPTIPSTETPAESFDTKEESRPPMWIICTLSAIVVVLSIWLYLNAKRHKEVVYNYDNEIKALQDKHNTKINNLISKHNEELHNRAQRANAEKNYIKEEAEHNYNKLRKTLEAENSAMVENLQMLIDTAKSTLGVHYLSILSGSPEGHFVGDDLLPTTGKNEILRWGNTYTFFANDLTSNSVRYHTCNCLHKGYQINAYTVRCAKKKYIPCKVCNPELPPLDWVNTYRTNLHLIQEIKRVSKISDQALSSSGLHPSCLRVKELQEFAARLGVSYNTAYNIMVHEYEGNAEKPNYRPQ